MRREDRPNEPIEENEKNEPIEQMDPVTVKEYQDLAEEKNTKKIGAIGERILGGFLRANGYRGKTEQDKYGIEHIKEAAIQKQEKDFIQRYEYYGDREQAYEVKVDRDTFAGGRLFGKASNEAAYGAFCGTILGGTGNLFIEEVQLVDPDKWGTKKNGQPQPPTEDQLADFLSKEKEIGWMEVIRRTPVDHPEEKQGRFVWFIPYMGYITGRRQLIIAVPDTALIELVEKLKGKEMRPAWSAKPGDNRVSWGRLLPVKDLFEFNVLDEAAKNVYNRASFANMFCDENGEKKYLLGSVSKNGSGAVAYLWDVDQGEDGYTTWTKAADPNGTTKIIS